MLQDAGLSCFEYVEQLTLLLFLKMADHLTQPPYERCRWCRRPSAGSRCCAWMGPTPDVLAADIAADLKAAQAVFEGLRSGLRAEGAA